ncbi:hypothetical protein GUITHDRAFT_103539 [Guillardia theta CCMP2712]|uniref:EGF-like domain-containing protein n=1 Tax=Guillardia theta (strain CCMP2712) TaxID=905079 RepID=L1JR84_GUITC|nr:hypothetical protein GUITHDRAFT_103539 [Guillardia theta CCMP2712]EKX50957.1 hypothetical protein GUITHDRAFT_103539 [Guillardia theta CCMP2712]|eukprot:XP_005837937.1 hypothetical protein GUITHDRAFT_103539 [Guillardia theta CCMP2712]
MAGGMMTAGELLLVAMAFLLSSAPCCDARVSKEEFEHGFRHGERRSVVAKNLPGRPLMIHNPDTLLLHHTEDRAHAKLKTRFRQDSTIAQQQIVFEKSSKSHYLVRVKYPAPADMLSQLKATSGDDFVQYIPYDTYVVAMELSRKLDVANMEYVESIYHLPSSMKISNDLQDYISLAMRSLSAKQPETVINSNPQHPEKRGTLDNSHKKHKRNQGNAKSQTKQDKYGHGKVKGAPAGPDESVFLEAAISVHPNHLSLTNMLRLLENAFSTSYGKIAQVWAKTSSKLTIETNAQNVVKVVEHLANQASVKWMEKRKGYRTMNKYSSLIVQGTYRWQPTQTKLEQLGLNGTGQTVGIADTGIDFDSCFFHDPKVEVLVCLDCYFSDVCSKICPAQPRHRKILSYNSYAPPTLFPQSYDSYHGHGTHVSGIVAGAAGPINTLATQYNGSAPGAKIVFEDVSSSEPYLNYLPWDLGSSLFAHAYNNGAKIHSNSWGGSPSEYDFQCMEIDAFMYSIDDFLVVFAAGNSGPNHFSIGSPGNAKNILSVGSSLNSRESYVAHGYGTYFNLSMLLSDGSKERMVDILPASFGAPLTPDMEPINASIVGQEFYSWCDPSAPWCMNIESLLCLQRPNSNSTCSSQNSPEPKISMRWSDIQTVASLGNVQSSIRFQDFKSCFVEPWASQSTCTFSMYVNRISGGDVDLMIQVPLQYWMGSHSVTNVKGITVAGNYIPMDFSMSDSQSCGQSISTTYRIPPQVSGTIQIIVYFDQSMMYAYACITSGVTFTMISHDNTLWDILYDSFTSQEYKYNYNPQMYVDLQTDFDFCIFGENAKSRTYLTRHSLRFAHSDNLLYSQFIFNNDYESYPVFMAGKKVQDHGIKGYTIYIKSHNVENSHDEESQITLYENNSITYTVITPVQNDDDSFSFSISKGYSIFSGFVNINKTVTLTGFSNPLSDYFRGFFKGSMVASPFTGYCDEVLMAWNAQNMGAPALILYEPSVQFPPPLLKGTEGLNDILKHQIKIPVAGISGLDALRLLSKWIQGGSCASGFPYLCLRSMQLAKLPLVSNVRSGQEYKHTDLSIFSSRGPTFDLRNKPDIVAPGQNIFSASSDGIRNSYQCADSVGLNKSCILEMSGTSMATPAIAGAAAIVRQYFEEGYQVTGSPSDADGVNPSSALVKAMIIQSGKPLRHAYQYGSKLVRNGLWSWFQVYGGSEVTWQESTASPSAEQGYGLLDLSSVLWFGADSDFVLKTYDRVQLSQVPSHSSVDGPPRVPYASKALMSDLDLVLIDSSGNTLYGNNRSGSDMDRTNNVEQITLHQAPAGTYSVVVSAYDLPWGSQNFALVVTGAITAETSCSSLPPCPNSCSGHGTCRASVCDCAAGYYSVDCSQSPRCGDGVLTAPEQCDDGNSVSGDGCSSTCQVEQGWECDQELWPEVKSSCFKCACGCHKYKEESGIVNESSFVNYVECVYDIEPTGLTSIQFSFPDMWNNPNLDLEIYTCANSDCSHWSFDGWISGTYMSLWLPESYLYKRAFRVMSSKVRVVSYSPFVLKYGPIVYDVCGDGIQEGLEACDDGNLVDGDGCSSTCKKECTAAHCCHIELSTHDVFTNMYKNEVVPGATCASFSIYDSNNGMGEIELAVIPTLLLPTVCEQPGVDNSSSTSLKFNGSLSTSQYKFAAGNIMGDWSLLYPSSLSNGMQNMDDGNWLLPDFGFDFCVNGKNVRNRTYISSNSYITFYNGFSFYSGLSASWPPTPTMFIGGSDTSAQLVLTKTVYEAGMRGFLVRFEGTASSSGQLGWPNIIWEATFFEDNRIRVSVGLMANSYGLSLLSDGNGKILLPLAFQQNSAELLHLKNLCSYKQQVACDRLELSSQEENQVLSNKFQVFRGRSLTLNYFSTVNNRTASPFPFELSWGGKSKPMCGNGLRDWMFRRLTMVSCTSTTSYWYTSTINDGTGRVSSWSYRMSSCNALLSLLINSTGPMYLLVDIDSTSLYGSSIMNVTLNGVSIPFSSPDQMSPMCGMKVPIVLTQVPTNVQGSKLSLQINVMYPNCWYCSNTPSCLYINAEAILATPDVFEQCDDGNQVDGDGCSSTCTIEPGATCDSSFSIGSLQRGPDVCLGKYGKQVPGGCSNWMAMLNSSTYPFLWGEDPSYRNCSLPYTWEEIAIPALKTCSVQYKMGGLGLLMTDQFQVWICVKDHPCALSASNPYFCFVYDEDKERFIPWGSNSKLQLFRLS